MCFHRPEIKQTPSRTGCRGQKKTRTPGAGAHYLPHAGRHQERVVVADHLKLRGFSAVDPDTVVMVSGAQHGLASVVLSMFSPGDVIATDALTYPGFKALAQTCHIELVPVPVTPEGPGC
ncbi:aminotransferase class I/II-fold pyridoxal phosphate-dependent enzyme [Morganella morganii]|uniref:aminotransferase class I/II-fold pyridoxal phosphate-dependent enzyme n=1 Tax=Morganella morganii TaxID=582 RepID=UPI001F16BF90|nr:aminotransferase class I/II-fold pyridoxal phosphate-dependent enzyme [Morganella morganii]